MLLFICISLSILLIISLILLAFCFKKYIESNDKKNKLINKNADLIDKNEKLEKQIFTLQLKLEKLEKLEKTKKEAKKTTTKKTTKKTEAKPTKKTTRKSVNKEDQ